MDDLLLLIEYSTINHPTKNPIIINLYHTQKKAKTPLDLLRFLFYFPSSSNSSWCFRRQSAFSSSVISRRTRHGLPTAITLLGMSFVTTEPEPITVLSPIVTPGFTVTLAPSHTLLPIVIGIQNSGPALRVSASVGCPGVTSDTCGPNMQLSPIVIGATSNNVQSKFA